MDLIADLDAIPPRGLVFRYQEGPFEEEGILVRVDGAVRAYKNECRHVSLRLDGREPGEVMTDDGAHLCCSHHGALYRADDGLCVAGPCRGSHLRPLPVHLEDGMVYLDTSRLGSFFDV